MPYTQQADKSVYHIGTTNGGRVPAPDEETDSPDDEEIRVVPDILLPTHMLVDGIKNRP